ncbi:AAA family ATPase [Spirosoma sp. SC4-14]|uniref:AAA family ATPase n=1 Tax=Spirosoma sp. SC4-14 TaxID=3128900 RepID=UPI0030D310FA
MLKRVSIQNFKSLKDVTLDLQKVNLLIGPNNSGKTNFLKALEFSYYNHNFFEVEDEESGVAFMGYDLLGNHTELVFKRNQNATITLKLALVEDDIEREVEINWSSNKSTVRLTPRHNYNLKQDVVKFIRQSLGEIIIYNPNPNTFNKPGPVGMGAQVINADASNLIAFFDYIRDEHPETFAQIKADLAKCVPEFTEINFQSVKPTEDLIKISGPATYKRIGLTDGRQKTIYWADELSEGTLYFIALLCIINQPNPPKLLLLEEPEKGIHPRRIHEVVQFILRLVEEKDIQVIMTTHSPVVLDMFSEMPESVFIFDKDEEGATHVKNLQHDVIEPDTEKSKELGVEPPHYTDALGDSWTIGFLGGVPK